MAAILGITMDYRALEQYIQTKYRYANVTQDEVSGIKVPYFKTTIRGTIYVGSNSIIDQLANKALVEPEQEVVTPVETGDQE